MYVCDYCGKLIEGAQCKNCGAINDITQMKIVDLGYKFGDDIMSVEPKSKIAKIVHKFKKSSLARYLKGLGITIALFCVILVLISVLSLFGIGGSTDGNKPLKSLSALNKGDYGFSSTLLECLSSEQIQIETYTSGSYIGEFPARYKAVAKTIDLEMFSTPYGDVLPRRDISVYIDDADGDFHCYNDSAGTRSYEECLLDIFNVWNTAHYKSVVFLGCDLISDATSIIDMWGEPSYYYYDEDGTLTLTYYTLYGDVYLTYTNKKDSRPKSFTIKHSAGARAY